MDPFSKQPHENSKAQKQRDEKMLGSLVVVINVLYALLIFQTFMILPRPDDPELEYHTLEEIFSENIMSLLVILIGLFMIILYWLQFNKQVGNLVRSSAIHASLTIIQMVFLMTYLYFLRFDIEFDGMTLALQMESVFLALAGFTAAFNWYYAKKKKIISDLISEKEKQVFLFKILPEPMASLFSLPFAVYGPDIWSLSFLVIVPLSLFFKWWPQRRDEHPKN